MAQEIIMSIEKYSEWIDSAGGPLLLVSDIDCQYWNGALSDYWSACEEVNNYVGVFNKKNKKFIILAEEPLSASIVCSNIGILFLRWEWGDEDKFNVFESLKAIKLLENLPLLEETDVNIKSGKYFLFDSALHGNTQEEKYEVILEKDVAVAKTYQYRPDEEYSFLINAFLY